MLRATGSGKERFYVMALADINSNVYCWYQKAYSNGIGDWNTVTSQEFGTGRKNTETMIAKWNASAYGAQNGNSSYPDMWGQIQTQVNNGWFVPSKAEWSAFGQAFEITSSNYSSTFGLSLNYWSSSLSSNNYAWRAYFYYGYTDGNGSINSSNYVRLGTTF